MTVRFILIVLAVTFISACDSGSGLADLAPETPRLFSPENGSVAEQDAVYLEWKTSTNADRYHLQVSKSKDFLELTTDTEFELQNARTAVIPVTDLEIGTTYFWRVRAYNENMTSDWSAAFRFTPSSKAQTPQSPDLLFPSNEQIGMPTNVGFRWQAVPNARFYHIQASQSTDFYNQEANMDMLTKTSQTVSQLIRGYTYYWRVRARNAAGFSPWSPTWQIIIAEAE